jgi:F-type H+-transporting ATPase subunit a
MFSPLEQFDMVYFFFIECSYPLYTVSEALDLQTIFLFFFLFVAVLYYLKFYYNSGYSFYLIPQTFIQRFIEIQFEFIFNLIKQQLGDEYYIYFSLVFTIFYSILFFNLLSLLPFGFALTSHIVLMLYISLSLGLGIFLIGINKHGLNFF